MANASPSGFLRFVLHADSFTTSSVGVITLSVVLLTLVSTDTVAGLIAAVVLFTAWVAIGWTGRRHQRRSAGGESQRSGAAAG